MKIKKTDKSDKKGKIQWHDAFYAALQLELHDYADLLIFEDEHQLSKKALIVDVLVIKKTADVRINKNIGQIFRMHNIFEYKSDRDSLSKWDYNKVLGYGYSYSATEKIPIEDITISFAVTQKPVKLLKYLTHERGFTVDEISTGIYYVKGETFAVQILVNKRLGENVFLKTLRRRLTKQDVKKMLNAYVKYKPLEKDETFLNRVFNANKKNFEEVLDMMDSNVRGSFYKGFGKYGKLTSREKRRIEERAEEKKAREGAFEMLKRNFDTKDIAAILKMPLEWVQNLKDSTTINPSENTLEV